jgi:hypothetical protein
MLDVMSMQWYVNLVTIAGAGILGWIVLEFLGKPIRTFFDLRDQVRAQLLLLANVAPPKPRETISTSLEIQQYDVALKVVRGIQQILRDLGSQMLAFSENEVTAYTSIAPFGFDPIAAGSGLIALSNTSYGNRTDHADFSSKIEEALRFKARGRSARREMVEQIAARLKRLPAFVIQGAHERWTSQSRNGFWERARAKCWVIRRVSCAGALIAAAVKNAWRLAVIINTKPTVGEYRHLHLRYKPADTRLLLESRRAAWHCGGYLWGPKLTWQSPAAS